MKTKEQRVRSLLTWLAKKDRETVKITSDAASQLMQITPRTARRYFDEISDEYDSITHKRADPNDASLPKRLCMDVEAFLEESDDELQ